MKETKFTKVTVRTTANGYTIYFEERRGDFSSKDYFVAKTLDEVKRIIQSGFVAPKDY